MKLAHFTAKDMVPNDSYYQLQSPTRYFYPGNDDVESITVNDHGTKVHVHRKVKPDIVFTAVGHGIMATDVVPQQGKKKQ